MDESLLDEVSTGFSHVVTIEDGTVVGGLHGVVAEYMSSRERPVSVTAVGIPDEYISQGTQHELRSDCGLTTDRIYGLLKELNMEIVKKNKKVLEN